MNQIRNYGESFSEKNMVGKILRFLSPRFDDIVMTIEESKDLSKMSKEGL